MNRSAEDRLRYIVTGRVEVPGEHAGRVELMLESGELTRAEVIDVLGGWLSSPDWQEICWALDLAHDMPLPELELELLRLAEIPEQFDQHNAAVKGHDLYLVGAVALLDSDGALEYLRSRSDWYDHPTWWHRMIAGFWQAIHRGDFQEAGKYMSGDVGELEEILSPEEGSVGETVIQALLNRIKLTPTGHHIEGDKARVDATVTMPDMTALVAEFMAEAMKVGMAAALDGDSEEEINKKISDVFLQVLEETEDTTIDHSITMVMEGGAWKISGEPFPASQLKGLLEGE